MTYDDITQRAAARHLTPMGGFFEDGVTTVLLGPLEPGFWDYVTGHPEFSGPDPLDHWSEWAITKMGRDLGGRAVFPFGGPPYYAFISWALRSGEAWKSPVGLIIHKKAGLMASYRGALQFDSELVLPVPSTAPCDACIEKPCLTACPVDAIGAEGYDVPRCKSHISTDPVCRAGCRVRLSCPVSQSYGRVAAQTAFHMTAFMGES